MISIDMTKKQEQRITDKHFSVENDILTLQVNLGVYDLTDKQVTAVFNDTETAPLTSAVVEGNSIVDIPVYSSYINEGINYVQLYFRWDTSKVENSSVMIWKIDKSILALEPGEEEQDLISYYLSVFEEQSKLNIDGGVANSVYS